MATRSITTSYSTSAAPIHVILSVLSYQFTPGAVLGKIFGGLAPLPKFSLLSPFPYPFPYPN